MINSFRVFWSWFWFRPVLRGSIFIVLFILVGWLGLEIAVTFTPLPKGLEEPGQVSSLITDRTGRPLRLQRVAGNKFFQPASLQECGPVFIQATLSAEDKRFWRHNGVDWIGFARVLKEIIWHGRVMSGGSTITQQLIKNSETPRRPRNIRTKIIEILQARKLERNWSKECILEAYLNRIDYGNLCRGAGTAAAFYFDKPLRRLSPAEAALLSGLPNAPTRLNPHRHIVKAQERQHKILRRMANNGWLSSGQVSRALSEPIVLHKKGRAFAAAHFVDLIQKRRKVVRNVRSTLDRSLNSFAKEMLRGQLHLLDKKNASNGSVVIIENQTGNVLALVGSRDYFDRQSGQVNGALAARSAGSIFKPFTYLLALEKGWTPASMLADIPVDFPTATGVFRPVNYDRRFRGPVLLREALANSLNVPAVKLLDQIGGATVLHSSLRRLGFSTLESSATHYGLGLTIGNSEARLLELTNAYATLARLGEHRPVRLLQSDPSGVEQVFEPEPAWLIADILSDDSARSASFGWRSALSFPFRVACKTGTSSEFRDNWAIGYTPEFTVGVWVGNFDGSPMQRVSGVSGAAPVMHSLMMELHRRFGTDWFKRPKGIEQVIIDPISGLRHPDGKAEWFIAGSVPPMETTGARDGNGRIFLPQEYAIWWKEAQDHLRDRTVITGEATSLARIVTPQPGTVVYLDPDLPASSRQLPLRVSSGAAIWKSQTLECVNVSNGFVAQLEPGRHELVAMTEGGKLRTWVKVIEE
jgi:penicillin-binding protein 1C